MSLSFYSAANNSSAFGTDPLRSTHDGRLGGAYEVLIFLRNNDPAVYYTDIELSYVPDGALDTGPLGNTGWSIKFAYGQRQPTEAEWDQVVSGDSLALPDLGASGSPDTDTYHPIWIRIYCPGETPAQLRALQTIRISYSEDVV